MDGIPTQDIPKAMVTSLYGHEDMIDYMSTYRTQLKFRGKKFLVKGGLFWFSCNRFGDFTGQMVFIKNVPDEKLLNESYLKKGYRKIKPKRTLEFKELFTKDITLARYKTVKPKLKQWEKWKGKKGWLNACNKEDTGTGK